MWAEAIQAIDGIFVVTTIVVIGVTVVVIKLCSEWCADLSATVPPHQQELRRLNAE